MTRQKPIHIEIQKHRKAWALNCEKRLLALTCYRKGAMTLEILLRQLIKYTSRKLFRQAVKEAFATVDIKAKAKGKSAHADAI